MCSYSDFDSYNRYPENFESTWASKALILLVSSIAMLKTSLTKYD